MKRASLILALAIVLAASWFGASSFASPAESPQATAEATVSTAPPAPVAVSSEACGAASPELGLLSAIEDGRQAVADFNPPDPPPTSCVCGSCCENYRCWRNGTLAKCLPW